MQAEAPGSPATSQVTLDGGSKKHLGWLGTTGSLLMCSKPDEDTPCVPGPA